VSVRIGVTFTYEEENYAVKRKSWIDGIDGLYEESRTGTGTEEVNSQ
jgi:hypothetical protein